jgi:diguanylate cyclase (GGDEF)-like protein
MPLSPILETDEERSPAAREVYLVVLTGPNVGQVYHLQQQEILIGRDDASSIQILDGEISRSHARVAWDEERAVHLLEDLGSSNGTRVNEMQIERPHALRRGDKIQLGMKTVMRVSLGDEQETQYAQQMYQAVLRDALTGVFNRRYLEQRLDSELAFANRHQTPLSLLFLDIDHFKQVNDNYDHQCGDAVLQQVANLVGKNIRAEDVLARYGGEEFAIVAREIDESQAAFMAERVRFSIEVHGFVYNDKTLRVTVSIGVATLDNNDLTTKEALLEAADRALLTAKEQGRNRVVRLSEL